MTITCPNCDTTIELDPSLEGRKVECPGCRKQSVIPVDPSVKRNQGLSKQEWWIFTILFLVVPMANVLVSSILYYVWKADQPKRANQINRLGFIIFGFDVVAYIGLQILIMKLQNG